MEASSEPEKLQIPERKKKSSSEGVKGVAASKTASIGSSVVSARKKVEPRNVSGSGSIGSSTAAPRRNSTGGLGQRSSSSITSEGRRKNVTESGTAAATKSASSSSSSAVVTEPVRRSLPELRRSSITATKPVAASPVGLGSRTAAASKVEVAKKPLSKPALSASSMASSSRRVGSLAVDGSGGGSARKTVPKVSSPSTARSSPSVSGGLRAGSLSSSSDRSSGVSGRRKVATTPDIRNSRFIVLPQIEIKASDDLVSFVIMATRAYIDISIYS